MTDALFRANPAGHLPPALPPDVAGEYADYMMAAGARDTPESLLFPAET
jgi:hypothetical protein